MENQLFIGSICLSDIPDEVKKDVKGKVYVNISIVPRKEVGRYGHTHFISCSPKKEDRKDGVNYFIGDVKPLERKGVVSMEDIDNAPVADKDDLPF